MLAAALSYSAVKLFSWTLQSESVRQTDWQTTYCRITALCVESRGKNWRYVDDGLDGVTNVLIIYGKVNKDALLRMIKYSGHAFT